MENNVVEGAIEGLRKLQLTELSILKEFDRVCRKNNIQYSLAYGTLLGAIRHKGFIPWDDDIDVMMTYDNYTKFACVAPKELKEKYYFQNRKKNPENYVFWNRIGLKNTTSIDMSMNNVRADWGICIDIFPIFPLSNCKKAKKRQYKWLKIFRLCSLKYYHMSTFKKSPVKSKIKKLPHFFVPRKINVILDNYFFNKFKKYKLNEGKECIDYSEYPAINSFKSIWFEKYIDINFEGKKYMAIKEWDSYLTTIYGDYMTPPSVDQREKHSDNPNVIIDYNNSFTKYLK